MILYLPSGVQVPDAHRYVHIIEQEPGDPIEKQQRRTLVLLHDWVFVQLHEMPEKYRNTIFIPESSLGKFRIGTVLGYGPGVEDSNGVRQPIGLERGEVVVFHRWNMEHKQGHMLGQFIGKDGALIRARDVLFVMPPGSEGVECV